MKCQSLIGLKIDIYRNRFIETGPKKTLNSYALTQKTSRVVLWILFDAKKTVEVAIADLASLGWS